MAMVSLMAFRVLNPGKQQIGKNFLAAKSPKKQRLEDLAES